MLEDANILLDKLDNEKIKKNTLKKLYIVNKEINSFANDKNNITEINSLADDEAKLLAIENCLKTCEAQKNKLTDELKKVMSKEEFDKFLSKPEDFLKPEPTIYIKTNIQNKAQDNIFRIQQMKKEEFFEQLNLEETIESRQKILNKLVAVAGVEEIIKQDIMVTPAMLLSALETNIKKMQEDKDLFLKITEPNCKKSIDENKNDVNALEHSNKVLEAISKVVEKQSFEYERAQSQIKKNKYELKEIKNKLEDNQLVYAQSKNSNNTEMSIIIAREHQEKLMNENPKLAIEYPEIKKQLEEFNIEQQQTVISIIPHQPTIQEQTLKLQPQKSTKQGDFIYGGAEKAMQNNKSNTLGGE